MYRRLILFGIGVATVAVVTLLIPLALANRGITVSENLNEAAEQARSVAVEWEKESREVAGDLEEPDDDNGDDDNGDDDNRDDDNGDDEESDDSNDQARIPGPDGPGRVTLILPDGSSLGAPLPPGATETVELAATGVATTTSMDSVGYAAAPAALPDGTGVVLVTLGSVELTENLAPRLGGLAGLSFLILGFAGAAAWLLAKRTVRPIKRLAATADELAEGNLEARVPDSNLPEVHDVGVALNRMAGRVSELLDDERASAAELAHQLRTPLTVLTIDIDSVTDPEVRTRLQEDALALQRTTDEIIRTARISTREGLRPRCDASEVLAERTRFWRVLAEDQHRKMSVHLPDQPLPVRLTDDDLATLTDILLQNIFQHTPEETGFEIRAEELSDGRVRIRVEDHVPPPSRPTADEPVVPDAQPGTTGLGLSIARRLAETSGGGLDYQARPGSGTLVTVTLGSATN